MGQTASSRLGRQSGLSFGANNLPALQFHGVHGENVRLLRDSSVARRAESFCKGIVFSNRPIKVNERVYLKFAETSTSWSGVLRFGFTTQDPNILSGSLPKYACPDLTNKPGYWAKALNECYAERDVVLYYYVTPTGDVHYGINGEEKGLFFSSVDTRGPLWVLLDIYGNTIGIEILDCRQQLNNARRMDTSQEEEMPDLSALSVGDPPIVHNMGIRFLPMKFHKTRGQNVRHSNDRVRAFRHHTEYCHCYVFSYRPLMDGERIVVQVIQTDTAYVGALAFGVTSCDPAKISAKDLPDDSDLLIDRPEYWVVVKDIANSPQRGDELSFSISQQGEVLFIKNNSPVTTVMHVDNTQRLWAVFDVYGSTQEIKFFGSTMEPLPPPQARPQPAPSLPTNRPPSSSSAVLDSSSPAQSVSGSGLRVSLPPDAAGEPSSPRPRPPDYLTGSSGDGSQDNASNECTVCYERDVDCVLYSCGHMCMCHECAQQQWNRPGGGLCPICRQQIHDVIKIYRS